MVLITIVTGAFVNQLSCRTGASHCNAFLHPTATLLNRIEFYPRTAELIDGGCSNKHVILF